jgi:hypothetical protein
MTLSQIPEILDIFQEKCAKAVVSLRLCFQKRGVESGTIQIVMILHKIADVF